MQNTLFNNPTTPTLPEDITAARHRGNSASIDANKTVNKVHDREQVYAVIESLGVTHLKEIARVLGRQTHTISGRISELLVLKRIERLKERSEGCGLLRCK